MIVGALVKLRREMREEIREKRTFRMPLYPLPLVVVLVLASYKMYNNLVWRTVPSVVGLALSVVSFPLYHFVVRRRRMRRKLADSLGVGVGAPPGELALAAPPRGECPAGASGPAADGAA